MKEDYFKKKILSRKIGKMGNSVGVSLPKVLIDKLDVSQGDEIEFIENSQGEIILTKVRQLKIPENVRPEVLEAFFDVFEEDEDILQDLRDR
ncbi:antitoxin MazE [Paenibacillus pabuli]|uniref:Antitoxin MazE n=1 Tax=Paenibacillus pabuli TaxID=1472 RepID=A0ABX9BE17_9BACL|nr:AbrB/MazE/SpoVT family DNA-binding domain-containing protein [Paenibacillus pabuli]RAI88206.1 antitoxin MazE [Paenibacillus pabuli]